MRTRTVSLLVLAVALGACGSEEQIDHPELVEVMPIVPLPPDSRVIDGAVSEDAVLFTFMSQHSPDDMATYYRRMFTEPPWTLISDTRGPDGALILYAENTSTPLWVRIHPTAGAPGSTIQLSGALIKRDTALADSLEGVGNSP